MNGSNLMEWYWQSSMGQMSVDLYKPCNSRHCVFGHGPTNEPLNNLKCEHRLASIMTQARYVAY